MSAEGPVIGLLGHFAAANIGDDACPTALLLQLRRRLPHARLVLFCRFPAVATERFGVPAHPVRRSAQHRTYPSQPPLHVPAVSFAAAPPSESSRWRARARAVAPLRAVVRGARAIVAALRALPEECRFVWRSYQRLRGIDLLIVTGSNPLFDYFGGFWEFPYTVWTWTVLTRLTGTRLAFASVGAGPIVSPYSGRLLAWSLRRARYVSFRDHGSADLMRSHGYRGTGVVRPDLAHSLPIPAPGRRPGGAIRVGINPMIVHHGTFWPESDTRIRNTYIESLAALTIGLQRDGYDVFFYGTQRDDRVSAMEVATTMRTRCGTVPVPEYVFPDTASGLMTLCASADILVTTRFHGAVFGVLMSRPTLAVCYQDKTREVLAEAGLGAFAFAFEAVSPILLRSAFDRLCRERHDVEARLREHALVMRARLEEQCDDLVGMLNGGGPDLPFQRSTDHALVAAQPS